MRGDTGTPGLYHVEAWEKNVKVFSTTLQAPHAQGAHLKAEAEFVRCYGRPLGQCSTRIVVSKTGNRYDERTA